MSDYEQSIREAYWLLELIRLHGALIVNKVEYEDKVNEWLEENKYYSTDDPGTFSESGGLGD